MSKEWQIVTGALVLMLLLAAMSGPVAVRLLQQRGTVSGTWLLIALAADLVSVLALAVIVGVGGYLLRRLVLVEVEAEE
jgi:hypothetical protein